MTDVLTDKLVITRKPHRCFGCGRLFPAGTKLKLIESVDSGEWHRIYFCPVCEKVVRTWSLWGDEGRNCCREWEDFMRSGPRGSEVRNDAILAIIAKLDAIDVDAWTAHLVEEGVLRDE